MGEDPVPHRCRLGDGYRELAGARAACVVVPPGDVETVAAAIDAALVAVVSLGRAPNDALNDAPNDALGAAPQSGAG